MELPQRVLRNGAVALDQGLPDARALLKIAWRMRRRTLLGERLLILATRFENGHADPIQEHSARGPASQAVEALEARLLHVALDNFQYVAAPRVPILLGRSSRASTSTITSSSSLSSWSSRLHGGAQLRCNRGDAPRGSRQ